jgi:hypothetical protein
MAVAAHVDSVALDTATGDQTVSPGSLSFTPVGAIFSGNLLTADGGEAAARWYMGAAASAGDERHVMMESEDASATSDCGISHLDTNSVGALIDNNVVEFLGDFTSFNASPAGYSLNLSNAPAAASILNHILLGGDITGFQTFVFNLGAGSGNKSLSTLSGTPSCVIFFTAVAAIADTQGTASGSPIAMVGWMCADGTQGVAGTRHTDGGAAGDTARWQRTDRCIDLRTVSADVVSAAFGSMDANGFTVTATVTTSNVRTYGVAIYGGIWKAGSFLSSTGTGTTSITTTGVAPKVSLFQTYGLGANTTTQTGGKRGFGACDGTRRWSVAYDDLDGADPTTADSYLDRTRALVSITAGTPTLDDAYDITHGAEGFTYDHEVASGVAIQVLYLVGGDAAAAGGGVPVGALALAGVAPTMRGDFRLTPTRA